MVNIGEIKTAKELGLVGNLKRTWLPCQKCGKERWTPLYRWRASHRYCGGCSQKIGGKQKLPRGNYKIRPDKLIKGVCSLCSIELPATSQYFTKNKLTKNGLNLGRCKRCLNKIKHQREKSTLKGRLNFRISGYIRQTLNGTKNYRHWEDLVGYSIESLIKHLQKKFLNGMSWQNYGGWHIDHIIPVSKFNFTSIDDFDFKRCWALSNLQPLWASENMKKNAKFSNPFQLSLKLEKQNVKGIS